MKALIFLCLSAGCAFGEARSSTSYSITTETASSSHGRHATSASYELDCSGDGHGLAISTSANYSLRTGFTGQLKDAILLELETPLAVVSEESTVQLSALLVMDDDTLDEIDFSSLTFSNAGTGVDSVSLDGLAQTSSVFEDSDSTITAMTDQPNPLSDTVSITVENSLEDNYREYGGDGLADSWQVGFFGQPPNANAAPGEDPDKDGQGNAFEFLGGYSPTDSGDFFTIRVDVDESSTTITPSRLIPTTLYTLERNSQSLDPAGWTSAGVHTVESTQEEIEITLPETPSGDMFFRFKLEPRPPAPGP